MVRVEVQLETFAHLIMSLLEKVKFQARSNYVNVEGHPHFNKLEMS